MQIRLIFNRLIQPINEHYSYFSTPFMVQIVTNILPHLVSNERPESELKSGLVILLGEGVAEVVWSALREARDDVSKVVKKVEGANEGKEGAFSVMANLGELQK